MNGPITGTVRLKVTQPSAARESRFVSSACPAPNSESAVTPARSSAIRKQSITIPCPLKLLVFITWFCKPNVTEKSVSSQLVSASPLFFLISLRLFCRHAHLMVAIAVYFQCRLFIF
jgi:hypothetical protein